MNKSPEITSTKPTIEYNVRTNLPTLRTDGAKNFFRSIEQKNIPKNINSLLHEWSSLIGVRMHYDALNYAIIKEFPIEEKQGGWIDKLSISELSMNPEQVSLLMKTLGEYKKQHEKGSIESINIDLLLLALKKRNFQEFVFLLVELPNLQGKILTDETFSKNWMQLYERKGLQEIMDMGIGNCKTLALITKMILELGDIHWKLGINSIQINEGADNHVTLKIISQNGIIDFDPMQSLYRETTTK